MKTEIRSIILSSLTTIGMRMHQREELHVLTANKYYGKLELVRSYTQCYESKTHWSMLSRSRYTILFSTLLPAKIWRQPPGTACCPLNWSAGRNRTVQSNPVQPVPNLFKHVSNSQNCAQVYHQQIYSVVAGLGITFSTGEVDGVLPPPALLATAFDMPNILFSVFVRQDLCSSYDACTNSSMCSTMSPKNVVDWLSDFFLRQLVAFGATAGAASDFTFCAVFCGCSDDDEALILPSNLLQTSSSQFCHPSQNLSPDVKALWCFSANPLHFLELLQLIVNSE